MPTNTPIIRGLFRSTRPRLPLRKFHTTPSPSPSPPPPSSSSSSSSSPPHPSNKLPSSPRNAGGNDKSNGDPRRPSWLGHPFRVILTTIKFVAFTHLIWEYGISMAPASGPSMLPTFEVLGEWLLVSKLHRFGRGISVGDVVAYNIPINDEVGVKRVLGLPGDYVLIDTPGGFGNGTSVGADSMIQVPQGHCWIVGDNLVASRDSRYFGPVPLALIRGKVIASVRPFSEFRWITNPLRKANNPAED